MTLKTWEFEQVRRAVRTASGIVLDDDKVYLVESRLAALADADSRFANTSEVVAGMKGPGAAQVIDLVVDALTTNETLFFRDAGVFAALETAVLPRLIAARREVRRLDIWSAACSSGQEPYSLLMLLDEKFPELRTWEVQVTATDISPAMLQRTADGRYSRMEVTRGLNSTRRSRYLTASGDGWRVDAGLRARLDTKQVNLCGSWPYLPVFDLVLIRNVLIYFDASTKGRVLERIAKQTRPDGCVVLGAGESLVGVACDLKPVTLGGARVYAHADFAEATSKVA